MLGPAFAESAFGLQAKDFAIIVLPLGFGIVTGILLLNAYGKFLPRRRVIEGGLIVLGLMLALLSIAGPISRFLQRADAASGWTCPGSPRCWRSWSSSRSSPGRVRLRRRSRRRRSSRRTCPEEVRGRVFGVLNMLVSAASFVPIIIVGPISDVFGTAAVIITVALSTSWTASCHS